MHIKYICLYVYQGNFNGFKLSTIFWKCLQPPARVSSRWFRQLFSLYESTTTDTHMNHSSALHTSTVTAIPVVVIGGAATLIQVLRGHLWKCTVDHRDQLSSQEEEESDQQRSQPQESEQMTATTTAETSASSVSVSGMMAFSFIHLFYHCTRNSMRQLSLAYTPSPTSNRDSYNNSDKDSSNNNSLELKVDIIALEENDVEIQKDKRHRDNNNGQNEETQRSNYLISQQQYNTKDESNNNSGDIHIYADQIHASTAVFCRNLNLLRVHVCIQQSSSAESCVDISPVMTTTSTAIDSSRFHSTEEPTTTTTTNNNNNNSSTECDMSRYESELLTLVEQAGMCGVSQTDAKKQFIEVILLSTQNTPHTLTALTEEVNSSSSSSSSAVINSILPPTDQQHEQQHQEQSEYLFPMTLQKLSSSSRILILQGPTRHVLHLNTHCHPLATNEEGHLVHSKFSHLYSVIGLNNAINITTSNTSNNNKRLSDGSEIIINELSEENNGPSLSAVQPLTQTQSSESQSEDCSCASLAESGCPWITVRGSLNNVLWSTFRGSVLSHLSDHPGAGFLQLHAVLNILTVHQSHILLSKLQHHEGVIYSTRVTPSVSLALTSPFDDCSDPTQSLWNKRKKLVSHRPLIAQELTSTGTTTDVNRDCYNRNYFIRLL